MNPTRTETQAVATHAVTASADPDTRPSLPRRIVGWLGVGDGDLVRVLILLLIVAAIAIVAPNFLSKASWIALSQTATVVILLAVGQSFVIITGGIDLSVGAVMALSAVVGAVIMRSLHADGAAETTTVIIGFAIMLGIGAAVGLVNGLVITLARITPFIVTLGMLSIATGSMNLLSGGTEVVGLPTLLGTIGNRPMLDGWLTVPVLVTIVVCVVAGIALAKTRFGLRTYVIGSNPGAARRAGIRVDAHLVRVYMLSGTLAGLAGFLLTTRFVGASPLAGSGLELASIAAAVIGGASLVGGRGSIVGTIVGALIMAVLQIGLILAGVASFWQTIAIGVITIAAVFGDQLRVRLSNERT